jgi:hypothetical protein
MRSTTLAGVVPFAAEEIDDEGGIGDEDISLSSIFSGHCEEVDNSSMSTRWWLAYNA